MKQSLKQTVKQQMASIELSNTQLNTLDTLQLSNTKPSQENRWWYSLVAAAAMIMLVILSVPNSFLGKDDGSMISQLAMEAAKNHLQQKPLEVSAGQLSGIRGYFTRLDFSPIESEFLQSKNLSLIGGRYCSLQGVTAAQLRFKPVSDDGVKTLYQVGYDPKIFKDLPNFDKGEEPITVYSKGVKVTLWVEKDVLFALTEE